MRFRPGCYPMTLSKPINPRIWPRNCSRCPGSGTSKSSHNPGDARIRILRIFIFPARSLVTGGQVSRVDPDATGLNPAWRNSMVYATLGTAWEDGATLAEIDAARQLLIQDMKILEGIAPDSGAYFNEVRFPRPHPRCSDPVPFSYYLSIYSSAACRLRDMNLTGRNPSSAATTTSSGPSNKNTIQTQSSSFTRVSDQTSGMQISSAKSETAFETLHPTHPLVLT